MKKKARGMFALVEGDCEWVIFSGRNYKVLLFLSSDVQDLILVAKEFMININFFRAPHNICHSCSR